MDTDNIIAGSSKNGGGSNTDTASNSVNTSNMEQTPSSSGEPKVCCKDPNGVVGGVGEADLGSVDPNNGNGSVVENGVKNVNKDVSPSELVDDRVPKIYVCTEHCNTNNDDGEEDDTTSVPYESSVKNSASDDVQSKSAAPKERDNSQVESGAEPNGKQSSSESSQKETTTVSDASNERVIDSTKQAASSTEDSSKPVEVEVKPNSHQEKDPESHQSSKENELETKDIEEHPKDLEASGPNPKASSSSSPTSSSPSSSSSSSAQNSASSKFSFFRSIQNIIIATKWSKLRGHHGPSKSHKHNGDEKDEDQDKQFLQKPEKRQRKISSKSQPGDLLKNQSDDDKERDSGINCDEHSESNRGREGLEYLDSSRNSKDKGSTKSHSHFSLFKRHNNSTDSQQQQQQQQQPVVHPPAELTERQKALLRSSWAEIGDSVGQVGVIAFIGLFETHPDVIDTFDQFRGMSLESVFTSISLKEHALRVMTTVEKFLNRIDRPEKLQKILEDLGKRHVGYKFKSEYIKSVGVQFICAMRPHVSTWTPEVEQAWTALMDTMTFHMEKGAFAEMQNTTSC